MFYIAKFHAKLHQATRQTVLAVDSGDVQSALRTAPNMAAECSRLAQEALHKAGGVLVSDNQEIYIRLSQTAQAFAEAGTALAQARNGDGTFARGQYQDGVNRLSRAVGLLG